MSELDDVLKNCNESLKRVSIAASRVHENDPAFAEVVNTGRVAFEILSLLEETLALQIVARHESRILDYVDLEKYISMSRELAVDIKKYINERKELPG